MDLLSFSKPVHTDLTVSVLSILLKMLADTRLIVSVFEIFYSWHKGMTLCAAAHSVLFRDLEKVIRILDVTHLSLTSTVASLVSPDNVPNVNFLITAGEEMTGKVFQEWADKGLYQGNSATTQRETQPLETD